MRAAGLDYRAWDVAAHEWSLNHVILCARLRLHMERTYPDAWWESDRSIRARRHGSGARVRLADGGLEWPDGSAVGIELQRRGTGQADSWRPWQTTALYCSVACLTADLTPERP